MTRDEVRAKLAELPDTADGIAAFLAERGVKGKCGDVHNCPITNYTGAWLTTEKWTWVSGDPMDSVELPPAVAYFVGDFDDGLYPELIA